MDAGVRGFQSFKKEDLPWEHVNRPSYMTEEPEHSAGEWASKNFKQ